MLPNVRFMAASVVATLAMMLFGFGLFAASPLATQPSALQAHPNAAPSPAASATRPAGPPLIIVPPVARTPDAPEQIAAEPPPAPEAATAAAPPPAAET